MCSQRLTRPGKLCRECERELGRARAAAASVDTLSGAVPLIDASRMAGMPPADAWRARLRSRPALLLMAFSIGLATAATGYVVQRTRAASADASVMLDRDVRNIKPRSFGASTTARVANFQPIGSPSGSPTAAAPEPAGNAQPASAPESPARHWSAARPTRVASGVATAIGSTPNAQKIAADAEPPNPVLMPVAAAAPGSAPDGLDRVLALSSALESCAQEPLFARIACEYRARLKYCAGVAARVAQCGGSDGPVDHGQ
jgi:hypothetical protein